MTRRAWAWVAALGLSATLGCASSRSAGKADADWRDPAIELVQVKGGCFRMGSEAGAPGGPDEKPAHEVCVSDFLIGKFEVTQDQWSAVMGSNPSSDKACGARCPVETVSWNDVQKFLERLNAHTSGGVFRLPTEAEWEYAARAGGKPDRYAGTDDELGRVAWYQGTTDGAHPVGTAAPNGFGLHDMSGNVWEWTADWYDPGYYAVSPRNDPKGPEQGARRVVRGGSLADEAFDQRVYYRNSLPPDYRSATRGFRVVKVPAGGR